LAPHWNSEFAGAVGAPFVPVQAISPGAQTPLHAYVPDPPASPDALAAPQVWCAHSVCCFQLPSLPQVHTVFAGEAGALSCPEQAVAPAAHAVATQAPPTQRVSPVHAGTSPTHAD
jgi:hypothetical protein